MVASYQRDAVRIPDLESQKQQKSLDAVEAAVDEISEEQVVCVGALAADLK